MANDFFNASGAPTTNSPGQSAPIKNEFANIAIAFDKLPALTGHGNEIAVVNATGTGLTSGTPAALGLLTAALAASTYLPLAGGQLSGALGVGMVNTTNSFAVSGSVTIGYPTRNQVAINGFEHKTSNDPADNNRSAIYFQTTAGASSSDGFISFITSQYGVARAERVRVAANGQLLNTANTTWGTNNNAYTMALQGGDASSGSFAANGAAIAMRGTAAGYNNNGIEFYAGGAERWRIDSSGQFHNLVGTAANAPIDVVSNAAAFGMKVRGRAADGIGLFQFTNNAGTVESGRLRFDADGTFYLQSGSTGNTSRMQISAAGDVGIGTNVAASGFKLDLGTAGAGTIGGVANIGGYSNAGAYSIWAGRSASDGGQFVIYGSGHANANVVSIYNGTGALAAWFQGGTTSLGPTSGLAAYALQVRSAGQTVANMTDAGAKGAAIYLRDTAGAGAGQGGAVLFGGFDMATPFAGIKGYITDAASNGRGDIVFLTRRVATDTALTETMRVTFTGLIQDGAGYELGFKGLPAAASGTGAFGAADRGKCVYASGGVTVPNATMSAGDVVTIYNNTAAAITITATVTTLRQAGTANTGNRTLAARGIATVLFISGTEAVITGTGLT